MNSQTTTATNYNQIKNRLFLTLWNKNAVRHQLDAFPHRVIGDIAILCMIYPPVTEENAVPVTNEMLIEFQISDDQLFADAYRFSPRTMPAVIKPMKTVLAELDEKLPDSPLSHFDEAESPKLSENGLKISVITNDHLLMGAAAILYPGVLKDAAQGRNLFLIPSSVHEFLYFPDNGLMNTIAIEHMIQDINRTEVSIRDRLSDHLYYYDCEADEIRLAS